MTLKRYDAVVNGVETILVLNAEDAANLGDSVKLHDKAAAPAAAKAGRAASNKARKPANKAAAPAAAKAVDAPASTPVTEPAAAATE